MSITEKEICRLCLAVVKSKPKLIDAFLKDILKILLLNLNFEVSRNPVICQACVKLAKKSLNIKSVCLNAEKLLISFAIIRKCANFEIKRIYEDNEDKMTHINGYYNICRFCLKQLQANSFISLDTLINQSACENILEYMPEMDFNVVTNPIICTPCRADLKTYIKFMVTCLNVEQKINLYCQEEGTNSKNQVKLEDILLYYSTKSHIKSESNTFKNSEMVDTSVSSRLLKIEELYIKNENPKLIENSSKNVSALMVDKFQHKYTYRKTHDNTSALKMNKCSQCPYQTKLKHNLKRHMIVHRDIPETEMYKCKLCLFITRRKNNFERHMTVHKDISEKDMFKCALCPYKNKQKYWLEYHMLVHKDVSEIEMYKCALCSYKTKRKCSLQRHMLVHKVVPEAEMYKCPLCTYKAKRKPYLETHMLVHKDVPETEMYECTICSFKTKWKQSLECHINVVHKGVFFSSAGMYTCALCAFKTEHKGDLKLHMLIHKNVSI